MVKIRLTRFGRHKLPYYRIVAIDSRSRRDGSYIELLGHYEPISGKIDLKEEIIINWLSKGAQPSETVLSMLKKFGIWKKYQDIKKESRKTKTKSKKENKVKK